MQGFPVTGVAFMAIVEENMAGQRDKIDNVCVK